MQRRLFLKRMTAITGAAAVPITAVSVAVQNNTRVQESTEALKRRLTEAEKHIDQLQASQKKAIKSGLVIAGLLVGIDLSLLL